MDEKKIIISIIIPVYNGEKYIERCIDSLLKESLNGVEIIVVNDGSTDKTGKILERYIDNITVITKSNGGVSSARNRGIEKANGAYITFLDADDEIPGGVISRYLRIVKNNLDIELIQGCLYEKENTQSIYVIGAGIMRKLCLGFPRSVNQFPEISREIKASVHGCYGKLFDSKIIKKNSLRFCEMFGLGEDLLFYFDYLKTIREVNVVEQQTYKINCVEESSTRRFNEKMPTYAIEFAKALCKRVNETDELYPEAMYQINMHVNKAISGYFANPFNKNKNKNREFQAFLKNNYIQRAYNYLAHNEKKPLRKAKYWMLEKGYVRLYYVFEKVYKKVTKH